MSIRASQDQSVGQMDNEHSSHTRPAFWRFWRWPMLGRRCRLAMEMEGRGTDRPTRIYHRIRLNKLETRLIQELIFQRSAFSCVTPASFTPARRNPYLVRLLSQRKAALSGRAMAAGPLFFCFCVSILYFAFFQTCLNSPRGNARS